MKKYRTLQNNYIKRNTFANNTFGYYRKPIFITFLSALIIAICSLLIVQVSKIEKNERKRTVVFIYDFRNNDKSDEVEMEYEALYPHLNFEVLNARVYQYDQEAINEINKHNAEKLAITQGFVIYITTIVLYDEFGRHSGIYTYTSNIDGVLEKKGWI